MGFGIGISISREGEIEREIERESVLSIEELVLVSKHQGGGAS